MPINSSLLETAQSSAELSYIPVPKAQVPVYMQLVVDEVVYGVKFNYNRIADFFTVDLETDEGVIVLGEKIVLGRPLFTTVPYPFENFSIIPMSYANNGDSIVSEYVQWGNFGEENDDVKLFLWKYGDTGNIEVAYLD